MMSDLKFSFFGLKLMERGLKIKNKIAKTAHNTPIEADTVRHENSVLRYEEITRPPIPPSAFPAMYNPVILPLFLGNTSSDMYASDTDVAPDSKKPFKALSATSKKKEFEYEQITEATEEDNSAALIKFFLGILSATNMAVNSPMTIPKVENEIARLL